MRAQLAGDTAVDAPRPERTAVDEAGVNLDQRRAGEDALERLLRGFDATHRDQGEAIADPRAQPAQHFEGALGDRGARQAARADLLDAALRGVQSVAADGGVGGDDAGEPEFECQVGHRVDVLVGQVGGDLHEHRHGHGVQHRGEDRAQRLDGLQIPQAGGVGGGDVDDHEVGERAEESCALGVVLGGLLGRHDLRLADVRADGDGAAALPEPIGGLPGTVVVESHPVHDRPVLGEAEQSRLRIARLCLGGDGADLGEPESERTPHVDTGRVLVETGRQAHRRGELHAEDGVAEDGVVGDEHLRHQGAQRPDASRPAHREEGEVVGSFRRQQEHEPKKIAVHELLPASPVHDGPGSVINQRWVRGRDGRSCGGAAAPAGSRPDTGAPG